MGISIVSEVLALDLCVHRPQAAAASIRSPEEISWPEPGTWAADSHLALPYWPTHDGTSSQSEGHLLWAAELWRRRLWPQCHSLSELPWGVWTYSAHKVHSLGTWLPCCFLKRKEKNGRLGYSHLPLHPNHRSLRKATSNRAKVDSHEYGSPEKSSVHPPDGLNAF